MCAEIKYVIPNIKTKNWLYYFGHENELFILQGKKRKNIDLYKSNCQEECVEQPHVFYQFTVFIKLTYCSTNLTALLSNKNYNNWYNIYTTVMMYDVFWRLCSHETLRFAHTRHLHHHNFPHPMQAFWC
jgi:hypothetical protein